MTNQSEKKKSKKIKRLKNPKSLNLIIEFLITFVVPSVKHLINTTIRLVSVSSQDLNEESNYLLKDVEYVDVRDVQKKIENFLIKIKIQKNTSITEKDL
jgi:hypothetical protein